MNQENNAIGSMGNCKKDKQTQTDDAITWKQKERNRKKTSEK
jgi:hypothetical protein